MLEYSQWKQIVSETGLQDVSELFLGLARYYDASGQREAAVQLWKSLVIKYPDHKIFKEYLAESYEKMENWDAAIGAWIVLLDDTPFEGRVLGKLANACKMVGRIDG
jgi:tetratricopeptide (TPR) repeat protein